MLSPKAPSHTDADIKWWCERFPQLPLEDVLDIIATTELDYKENNNEAS
jgi:hypothetical protein